MPVKKLPTFRGYIIDFRLGEFRTDSKGHEPIEFIKFNSEKGKQLFRQLNKEGYTTPPLVLNDQNEWVIDEDEL